MKNITIKLIIVILASLLTSNSFGANPKKITEQDSIQAEKIIKKKIESSISKYEYRIKTLVKMILADNSDTYIVKGKMPTPNCFVEIYHSNERTGEAVIIYWDKELNSVMKFIVTQTQNNLTDLGVETTYMCEDPSDINNKVKLTRIENKDYINFAVMFDYSEERKAYMQNLYLIVDKE